MCVRFIALCENQNRQMPRLFRLNFCSQRMPYSKVNRFLMCWREERAELMVNVWFCGMNWMLCMCSAHESCIRIHCLLGCRHKIDHSSSSLYNFYSCFAFFVFSLRVFFFCRTTSTLLLLQYTFIVNVFFEAVKPMATATNDQQPHPTTIILWIWLWVQMIFIDNAQICERWKLRHVRNELKETDRFTHDD